MERGPVGRHVRGHGPGTPVRHFGSIRTYKATLFGMVRWGGYGNLQNSVAQFTDLFARALPGHSVVMSSAETGVWPPGSRDPVLISGEGTAEILNLAAFRTENVQDPGRQTRNQTNHACVTSSQLEFRGQLWILGTFYRVELGAEYVGARTGRTIRQAAESAAFLGMPGSDPHPAHVSQHRSGRAAWARSPLGPDREPVYWLSSSPTPLRNQGTASRTRPSGNDRRVFPRASGLC